MVLHIEVELSDSLRSVDVEKHAVLVADLTDFENRLNRADFVIHAHDGNERRIRADGGFNSGRIHETVTVDIEVSHLVAFGFETAHRVENSLMFRLLRDEMLALILIEVEQRPSERWLSASVAPEVQTISRGSALISAAT